MSDRERQQRHLELLKKSRENFENTNLDDRDSAASKDRRAPAPQASDDDVMMYRGRPVRRSGSGPSIPGAGGKSKGRAGQFRGAGGGRSSKQGGGDVRQALERLNELYADGLISKADFDRKHQQILDRL